MSAGVVAGANVEVTRRLLMIVRMAWHVLVASGQSPAAAGTDEQPPKAAGVVDASKWTNRLFLAACAQPVVAHWLIRLLMFLSWARQRPYSRLRPSS